MSKTIIFCADGTWNGPGEDDKEDVEAHFTNVFKLFVGLAGAASPDSIRLADEQEKVLEANGRPVQISKYIHGVGDSRNPIRKVLGGAFGAGVISRVVRGYTFISRNYEPGDGIIVIGFSRGAYTARALAGLILSQGVLAKRLTADKEKAYEYGAQAWYRYRKSAKTEGARQRLAEALSNLPGFLTSDSLKASDLVTVDGLKAVAVWDTVGALGLPDYVGGERVDTYGFTNTSLSERVEHGLHAIALDEQRIDFTPTLWTAAANARQMVFAGAHADVGGGYPIAGNESGLSDIALKWMADELAGIGVIFASPVYSPFTPDPKGVAHKPWLKPPFNLPGKASPRNLRNLGLLEHPSLRARRDAGPIVSQPGEAGAAYVPANWDWAKP